MNLPDAALIGRTGLQGHLRLTVGVDEQGRTYLRKQSFRAPVHLSKPHTDEGVLVVNVVNPTAGLLDGDVIDISVQVGKDARFLLTNPAATRVLTMQGGKAVVRQCFSVAAGGWLDVWPDLFIAQRGARYEQTTEIQVEPGGELLFFELLTPGRVAFGESFAFDRLDWSTDLFLGQRLIARERFCLSPDSPAIYPLRAWFPEAYQANCFVVSEELEKSTTLQDQLLALQSQDLWIGCSRLVRGGWVVKMLTRDSVALRKGIEAVRTEIYTAAKWPKASLRRI